MQHTIESTLRPVQSGYARSYLRVGPDVKLEVVTAEPRTTNGETPRLLFVHGLWHGAWCWEHFLSYFLNRGYPVGAFSLRGHGLSHGSTARSTIPWRDHSLDDYLRDFHAVLNHFGNERLCLVAHSMGGYLAQLALCQRNVESAILMASLPPSGILSSTIKYARRHPLSFAQSILNWSLDSVIPDVESARALLLSSKSSTDLAARIFSDLSSESFRVFLDALIPFRVASNRIRTPVQVIGAIDDAFISKRAVERTAIAYGVKPTFLTGIGHDMMLDTDWRRSADLVHSLLPVTTPAAV